ncbi:RNA polymerase sigma factor [Paenibacillus radicis (ex Gao et al. 2016)]|uniref:RNA polymerase sigma factor n=2 Tax=Paenibacillus radicis (ex Gao et al. 2016) TaxID=1737354 RepID=A0A917H5I4_9BACL|nr:RNA polymerase sigma factor [Paenibacillus radicis (ex Gao et al. 2016)]
MNEYADSYIDLSVESKSMATENRLESMSEEQLTAMATEGNNQAFGELVRRNRANMYKWARSLTQDHHVAEDVVQEALVQAFLQVGRLADQNRFAAWLARIVRNQAYMKLRRGGLYAKEQPFTGITSAGTISHGQDIDRVLFQLSRRYEEDASRHTSDPAANLLRKELVDGIRQLFSCLSPREKDIFEAHFFRQVSPHEIAIVLDTSVANVYNSISRARGKLQRERLRLQISLYVKQRRDTGKPKAKLLAPPILYNPKEC